jgi:DNA-binding NtrC family response regulator
MRKVLIIDDNPLVCEVISDCFEIWPATIVDCAQTGEVAAHKLREQRFDLALIDSILPGFSGLQLAERAANQNTPALLLSGHPDVSQKLERFGYPYLKKPVSLTQLLLKSQQAMALAYENVCRIKDSAARLQADIEAAKATMAASRRLVDKINAYKGRP